MSSRQKLPEGLLEDVKNFLDITWEDEATDRKIGGFIASGMAYINDKAGGQMDYSLDGYCRTLLMEYVRYARDVAIDVFETNYRHMLLAMQTNRRVRDYAAASFSSGE